MSDADRVGTSALIRGVPHPLPTGESVLWQGAPNVRAVATHVFHWRLFALYFAAMLLWWAFATSAAFGTGQYYSQGAIVLTLSAMVLGIAWGLSALVASSTWYAITTQRLVLRIGMVFPMSINVPFSAIESAGVGEFKDGTGQVALSLSKAQRIAYIALWPHCRVLRFANPEPVLRGLTDPQRIGRILAQAVAESGEGARQLSRPSIRASAPEGSLDGASDAFGLPQPARA